MRYLKALDHPNQQQQHYHHQQQQQRFQIIMREVYLETAEEARQAQRQDGKIKRLRADLIVTTRTGEKHTIDVSFANPACHSAVAKGSDEIVEKAASLREKDKRDKYGRLGNMEPGGTAGFTPFVAEATGRLGAGARKFLKVIVINRDETYHLSQFYDAFSALSALSNALMFNRALQQLGKDE